MLQFPVVYETVSQVETVVIASTFYYNNSMQLTYGFYTIIWGKL